MIVHTGASRRSKLALAFALFALLLAGCDGSGDDTAPSRPGAAEFRFDTLFADGIFSARASPLELSVTPAPATAVSRKIGPEGGQLVATAPDGTTYTLDVPPGALPVPAMLTATPLTDVAGLPFDVQPEHRIGVALTPSGMKFAKPVTLTIRPAATLPDAGVATIGYRGSGHDAGVELATQEAGTLQLSIEHFSGYVATWPIREADWRTLARQVLEARERFIRHVMATWLGYRRLMLGLGADPSQFATDVEFARNMLGEYVAEVLEPRIQAAATGCRESTDAIEYWLAYWRHAQLLGVADDPDFFVTINGRTYTSTLDFPESLLPTAVEQCFQEDYQRCVASGDFFLLYRRLFGFERMLQLLGQEMEPAWITLMIGYLQKCGHWDFEVATRSRTELEEHRLVITASLRRTIKLAWKAGDGVGMAAVYGAKITGSAEPALEQANATSSGDCTVSLGSPSLEMPAEASLRSLEWEYPDDPAAPDWAASGFPTALEISLHPGTLRTTLTVTCPGPVSPAQLPWEYDGDLLSNLMVMAGHALQDEPDGGALKARFVSGWEFSSLNPFRAQLAREGPFASGPIRLAARLEMNLRHAPQ